MVSLRDIFKKQTGFLRALKLSYVINNLLNVSKLRHNRDLYKQYGLKKSIFAPVGSHDFKQPEEQEIPWLDRAGAEETVRQSETFKALSQEEKAQVIQFIEKGYMIFPGFYNQEEVGRLNAEVNRLRSERKADFNYTGKKIMDAYRFSELIEHHFFRNDRLIKLLNFIMGKPVHPFQTINFIEGSEQRAHSDSIHMTTQPPGYLIAVWTALEDVDEGNGPLFYYPGSHRLPYITTMDYKSGNSKFFLGENSYRNYEEKMEEVIRQHNLKKEYFHAAPGDILIWHANLLHGGAPITRQGTTRKSMVAHYFCKGVICYHEISQRPALIMTND